MQAWKLNWLCSQLRDLYRDIRFSLQFTESHIPRIEPVKPMISDPCRLKAILTRGMADPCGVEARALSAKRTAFAMTFLANPIRFKWNKRELEYSADLSNLQRLLLRQFIELIKIWLTCAGGGAIISFRKKSIPPLTGVNWVLSFTANEDDEQLAILNRSFNQKPTWKEGWKWQSRLEVQWFMCMTKRGMHTSVT